MQSLHHPVQQRCHQYNNSPIHLLNPLFIRSIRRQNSAFTKKRVSSLFPPSKQEGQSGQEEKRGSILYIDIDSLCSNVMFIPVYTAIECSTQTIAAAPPHLLLLAGCYLPTCSYRPMLGWTISPSDTYHTIL